MTLEDNFFFLGTWLAKSSREKVCCHLIGCEIWSRKHKTQWQARDSRGFHPIDTKLGHFALQSISKLDLKEILRNTIDCTLFMLRWNLHLSKAMITHKSQIMWLFPVFVTIVSMVLQPLFLDLSTHVLSSRNRYDWTKRIRNILTQKKRRKHCFHFLPRCKREMIIIIIMITSQSKTCRMTSGNAWQVMEFPYLQLRFHRQTCDFFSIWKIPWAFAQLSSVLHCKLEGPW